MAESVETLHFESDTAAVAADDASAVDKLSAALKAATGATDKLGPSADKALKGIKSVVSELGKFREEALERADPSNALIDKLKGFERIFGPRLTAAFAGGLQKMVGGLESMFGPAAAGKIVQGISMFGPAAAGAAGLVIAAVVLLTAAAVKLVASFVETSIAATSFREKTVAGLEAVTKSASKAQGLFDKGLQLAIDLDLDEGKTLERIKGLLLAGFREDEVEVVIKAVADVTAVGGDEKGQALQKKLEAIQSGNKFDAGAVEGLKEAGVQTEAVYKKLAQATGLSFDEVKAKVKAGQIEVKDGIKAILEAVEETAGGAAAKAADTVEARLRGVGKQVTSLFSQIDTGPLKNALGNLSTILSGEAGGRLKSALEAFGAQTFKTLFGPFEGKEGAQKLTNLVNTISEVLGKATKAMQEAEPYVKALVQGFDMFFGARSESDTGFAKTFKEVRDVLVAIVTGDFPMFKSALASLLKLDGIDVGGASAIGKSIITGIVEGITSGAGQVIGAVTGLVQQALGAGMKAQRASSPSKAWEDVAGWGVAGFAGGFEKGTGRAAKSAAGMVDAALAGGAANDNAPAGAAQVARGGAGKGGRGDAHFHIHLPESAVASSAGAQHAVETMRAVVVAPEFRRQFTMLMREFSQT